MALNDNGGSYVAKVIYQVAEQYEFRILELAVMLDHIHLFASAPPDVAPAKLIQTTKSINIRNVFEQFPGIKRILRGGALLERGYFLMISRAGITDEMILAYIKEHNYHSANNQSKLLG